MEEVDILIAQWSVTPHPFQFKLADWREHTKGCSTAGGLGCIAIIIVGTVSLILLTQAPGFTKLLTPAMWWLTALGATVFVLLLLSFFAYYLRITAKHKREAAAATAEARIRFKDIGIQSGSVNISVERAIFYLDVADREFKEHRYAPFWDAMEAAATAIGECHTYHGYLAFDIDHYVNALAERIHNFPTWDLAMESLQEIEPSLGRFADLKIKAESDFHFANIRELRETRQVMIAGFQTLGEALRHLERAVVDSVGDLKRAVNRSLLLRLADPTHLSLVARFLARDDPAATEAR